MNLIILWQVITLPEGAVMPVSKNRSGSYVSRRLGNPDRPSIDTLKRESEERSVQHMLAIQNSWTKLHDQYVESLDVVQASCAKMAEQFYMTITDVSLQPYYRDLQLVNQICIRLESIRNAFTAEMNDVYSVHRFRTGGATSIDDNAECLSISGRYMDIMQRFGAEITECANQLSIEVKLATEAMKAARPVVVEDGVESNG